MTQQHRITQTDLNWWFSLAPSLEWTFALTYAQTAPHHYVVFGRTEGMAKEDYVRAARVIHTFGRPQKFYGMTSIYLTSADQRLKWWTMDRDVKETGLINQATTDRLYGVQNAPVTESSANTRYDGIATSYDDDHPTTDELALAVREAVAALRGDYPPAILDVGCGTGRVLDLGVTTTDRYAGVDPSKPMLNQLVRKHPGVGALYPMQIEQALTNGTCTEGQFEIVTVLLDPADKIDADSVRLLTSIASRGAVLARGSDVTVVRSRPCLLDPEDIRLNRGHGSSGQPRIYLTHQRPLAIVDSRSASLRQASRAIRADRRARARSLPVIER